MHRWSYIGLAVAVVLLSAFALPHCRRWWRIDTCLDAGGAWEEQTNQCVLTTPTGP
ncbi:hypothetical protein [Myxococcus landrumensis]|uniref:Lipoprotein n=1 Tax=Myxococcus landrumensis TaxID=2813577 RepID=A0ABX7N6I8_9BACT|nr:hypothetical protein [Myxococcus landrumus]QSQ13174.1 hypothetical protein JY572_33280 [Myxococcus landrumus]